MLRRVLTGLTVSISLGAILTLTTTPSHAVPVAGDYTVTGLITGTFHSDGTRLTTWEFTDSFNMIWTPSCGTGCVTEQTPQYFDQHFSNGINSDPNVLSDFREIYIVWDRALRPDLTIGPPPEYYAASDDLGGAQHNSGVVVVVPRSVPEPSSALLLLAGLGLLAGYGVRQWRQAGLEVG